MTQIFVFALCSILDVHVRAAEMGPVQLPSQATPLEQPVGCLKLVTACGLSTAEGRKYILGFKNAQVTLGPQTVVIRQPNGGVDLVNGVLLVVTSGDFSVRVPSGEISLKAGGSFLIERSLKGVTHLTALEGEARLLTLGRADEPLDIPAGFQNWMGPVGASGKANVGIPNALDTVGALRLWATLYSGTKNEFRKVVEGVQSQWRASVEASSTLHEQLLTRTIASEEARIKREQDLRRTKLEDRRRVRNWFFQKTFEY